MKTHDHLATALEEIRDALRDARKNYGHSSEFCNGTCHFCANIRRAEAALVRVDRAESSGSATPTLYSVLARAKNIHMQQHNLLSTATDQERRDTIARLINWWNNEALPAVRLVDPEVWP